MGAYQNIGKNLMTKEEIISVIEGVSELREIAVVEEIKHYHKDVFGKIYALPSISTLRILKS